MTETSNDLKPKPIGIRPTIKLNDDQKEAFALATNNAYKYLLFYGPSRSGKSFLILFIIILRALRAPNSRHFIGRGARNACEDSLFKLTLHQVLEKCFAGLKDQCEIKLSDMTVRFPNGSMLKFDGLDADRIDKVLGQEYNTIWINECNDDEVDYDTVSQLMTRLSMATPTADGKMLANKMFFDCNPRFYSDWEYKAFKQHINPSDGDAMPDGEAWVCQKLNTTANLENLSADYMNVLAGASQAKRQRFMIGEWVDENTNALFMESMFRDNRIPKPKDIVTPRQTLDMLEELGIQLERLTIAADPAVTADLKSDLTGITVQGRYTDDDGTQHCVVLADYSDRHTPDQTCAIIADAYHQWGASAVVMENNQGGLWLDSTLRKHLPNVRPTFVNANSTTGGKGARAEPVSVLYSHGVVHHVGTLNELEIQMCEFGSPASRRKSPDRMDAVVWGITEMMNLNGQKQIPKGGRVARRGNRR